MGIIRRLDRGTRTEVILTVDAPTRAWIIERLVKAAFYKVAANTQMRYSRLQEKRVPVGVSRLVQPRMHIETWCGTAGPLRHGRVRLRFHDAPTFDGSRRSIRRTEPRRLERPPNADRRKAAGGGQADACPGRRPLAARVSSEMRPASRPRRVAFSVTGAVEASWLCLSWFDGFCGIGRSKRRAGSGGCCHWLC